MAKPKGSPTAQIHRDPVHKKTQQGAGRGSKPSHGRKQPRGQGR
jgi:hypothetical protein